ncbi:hypothetical protein N7532_010322 [Penicillium argentinense]|uniref:Histone chaperone RTT106/FACT complex subunit SPT16-like middle domain-containing protein n=1 Tax=Penicillium argentinense TaxID=1131581 RepID=A0A9W9EPF8_9EURO|nr:uncharacterized protein N7532_010322 [Penicillium argentinense]KAJ5085551.1 hypothetical protein N7532_010322 [Penicillium argentinense]
MSFAAINSAPPAPAAPNAAIEEAFATVPALKKRVYAAIDESPQHASLFEDISRFTSSLLARPPTSALPPASPADTNGPAAKKRKLENGVGALQQTAQAPVDVKSKDAQVQYYIQDVSFSIPQRKKFTLEITSSPSAIRARNQSTKEVDFGIPLDKIRHAVSVGVPEKAQKQYNFCIIPEFGDGITPPSEGTTAYEPIVFTINDGPAKAAFAGTGKKVAQNADESAETFLRKALNEHLPNTTVIRPEERQFVSANPEPHRTGEHRYSVKAFRGSKEGMYTMLSLQRRESALVESNPLLFFSFDTIESVSYTSILQRTFNLNILARPQGGSEEDIVEFEFGMVDQVDFDGIDEYIKKHSLQDASLAEARRAKVYNVNHDKKAEAEGANGIVEEESELAKAQRELEDEEDEEDEEDYDPGSDGESEGSGSDEDESGDEDDDEDEDDMDEDEEDDGPGGDENEE